MGRVGGSWVGGLLIMFDFTSLSNIGFISAQGTGWRSASAQLNISTAGAKETGFFWKVFFQLHKSHIPGCTEEAGRRWNYLQRICSQWVFPICQQKSVKIKGEWKGNISPAFFMLVEHKAKPSSKHIYRQHQATEPCTWGVSTMSPSSDWADAVPNHQQ